MTALLVVALAALLCASLLLLLEVGRLRHALRNALRKSDNETPSHQETKEEQNTSSKSVQAPPLELAQTEKLFCSVDKSEDIIQLGPKTIESGLYLVGLLVSTGCSMILMVAQEIESIRQLPLWLIPLLEGFALVLTYEWLRRRVSIQTWVNLSSLPSLPAKKDGNQ